MKFFLEGSAYLSSTLKDALGDDLYGTVIKGSPSVSQPIVDCVGYCFSRDRKEHIFILPKVFLKDGKAFGFKEIDPKAPIDFSESFRKELKDNGWNDNVIEELPLYLYLAIEKFRKASLESGIGEKIGRDEVMSSKNVSEDKTLLDIILTLRDFYRDNQNLFVLIYKQTHSGFNKVNWTKTVRTQLPVISGDDIIYPAVINRRREVNYNEELLVLFFNTLRYINGKYGFRFIVDQPYNLMPDGEFRRKFESGVIKKRLEAIRSRYYNEKLIELWQLLHLFADRSQKVKGGKSNDEYLLVRRFNIVFEAMIDALLGDTDAPPSLIRQSDGKIVDHLFKGDSILGGRQQVYYIGDSKYYKEERHPEGDSLFKQYTYARNIIQQEINWYHSGKSAVIYRDPLTEGYNITPNFFICGSIDKKKGFSDDALEPDPHDFTINYQFPNRLFDRDTLFLREYNINFLFVLYAYTAKAQSVRTSFKEKAKAVFKGQFTEYINRHYDFFILKARDDSDESLENLVRGKLFWRLNGKVISPYPKDDVNHGLLALGLENPSAKNDVLIEDDPKGLWKVHNRSLAEDNTDLLLELEKNFIIKEYRLGTDPYVYYGGTINGVETSRRIVLLDDIEKNLAKYKTETVLFGCYRSKEQLEWILANNLYNVRYTESRAGTVFGHNQQTFTASYLILYNFNDKKEPARCFILGTRHQLLSHNEMAELHYPFGKESSKKDWYFLYRLEGQPGGTLPVEDILSAHPESANGSPLYLHFAEVNSVANIVSEGNVV